MKADSWFKVVIALFVFCAIVFGAVLLIVMPWGGRGSDDSCPDALDAAEVVMHKAEVGFDAVSDAIDSYVASDSVGLAAANSRLTSVRDSVGADIEDYNRLAAECRGN